MDFYDYAYKRRLKIESRAIKIMLGTVKFQEQNV